MKGTDQRTTDEARAGELDQAATVDEEAVRRRLEAAIQKYGFTTAELGPAWRRLVEVPPASPTPQ